MKSIEDYQNTYKNIAKRLNLTGDSVEMIQQMLAYSSYMEEVELVNYVQEASFERSTLLNSKIQHSMNEMYSVTRGLCPRVIINFKPTKYFKYSPFDLVTVSNNFKVYYLGYLEKPDGKNNTKSLGERFKYDAVTIPPSIDPEDNSTWSLICLVTKDTVDKSVKLTTNNLYYFDITESNLSDDVIVRVNGKVKDVTKDFSDHFLNGKIFDLTLPDLGSRLYVSGIYGKNEEVPANTTISVRYFLRSRLADFNKTELKRLDIEGGEMMEIEESRLGAGQEQVSPGIVYIPETLIEDPRAIHYNSNLSRFSSTIFRSRSDLGILLEKAFPDKVRPGGTSITFSSVGDKDKEVSSAVIHYIPMKEGKLLETMEKTGFTNSRKTYYITDKIEIVEGTRYEALASISLSLYQQTNQETLASKIKVILDKYSNKFGVSFGTGRAEGSKVVREINSLISKLDDVKISAVSINIKDRGTGEFMKEADIKSIDPITSYYNINYTIDSEVL